MDSDIQHLLVISLASPRWIVPRRTNGAIHTFCQQTMDVIFVSRVERGIETWISGLVA